MVQLLQQQALLLAGPVVNIVDVQVKKDLLP